jgi:two-component system chemotaxis sensor kinase CheA
MSAAVSLDLVADPAGRADGRVAPRPPPAPPYPGAILRVGFDGSIEQAWLGPASPTQRGDGDLFAALDVDDSIADASRLQLVLASTCGGPVAAWPLMEGDCPVSLTRRDGQTLELTWQPIVTGNRIEALAAFVKLRAIVLAELIDPGELNRLCLEAQILLDEADAALAQLRADPQARAALHRIFRAVHTVKGSSRGSQLRSVRDLAHDTENSLAVLRGNELAPTFADLAHVAHELERLRAEVVAARPRGEIDDAMTEFRADTRPAITDLRVAIPTIILGRAEALETAFRAVERVGAAADRARLRALQLQASAALSSLAYIRDGADPDDALLAEVDALDAHVEFYERVYRELAASPRCAATLATINTWMVSTRSGDLGDLARELVGAGSPTLAAALEELDPNVFRCALAVLADAQAMFEPARSRDDVSLRLERAQRELLDLMDRLTPTAPSQVVIAARAAVERLTWTPLSVIGRRLTRMQRSLIEDAGKELELQVELGDGQVAPEIGRVLGDILVHAIRNCADHGLEPPEERLAHNKAPVGTIRIQGYCDGVTLSVTVTDDGRGIQPDKIREVAVARGLLNQAEADLLQGDALYEVIFLAGFSTASGVTALSGRGVGLDVVKSLAAEHGGTVALRSVLGLGTELSVELPIGAAG